MTRPFRCRQDPGVADRNADRGRCDRDALARIQGDGVAVLEPLRIELRHIRPRDRHAVREEVAAFCGIVPAVEIIVVARGGRQVVGLVDIGGDRARRYRAALRIKFDWHRFLLPDRVECDESVRRRIELVTGLEHRFTRGEGRARGFGVRRPARDLITPAAAFPPGDAPRHIADGDLDRVRVDQSPFAVGAGESAIVGLVDEIVLEPREARCRVQIVVPVRRIIGIPADGKEVICRRGDDAGRGNIGEPGIARIAKTVPEHPLVKRIASRRDGGQPDGGRGREKNQPVGRDGRILVRLRMPIAVEVVIRLCDGDHRRRVDDERRHHPRKPGQKLPHNALSFFRRRVTGS